MGVACCAERAYVFVNRSQKKSTEIWNMCAVRLLFVLLCFISVLSTSCEKSDSPVDIALAESIRAMHSAMHAVSFIGKPDGDFARMMIPHHQGAIEMAKVELQFRTDPTLRRLAQEIIDRKSVV